MYGGPDGLGICDVEVAEGIEEVGGALGMLRGVGARLGLGLGLGGRHAGRRATQQTTTA